MIWHGGFPLFVIAYAMLVGRERKSAAQTAPDRAAFIRRPNVAILMSVAAVIAGVGALTGVVTAEGGFLPVLITNARFTPQVTVVVSVIWLTSLAAVIALTRLRPYTVLDLWVIVVMCAWLFDIGLSAWLNAGRYDVGWYAGRLYGLLAASFVLIVLLVESSTHYARLANLSSRLGEANAALERQTLQDGLTDLANRRYFDRYLADQFAIAKRHARVLSLVMLDIDAFKAFNDRYGHPAGDACLKQIAAVLRSCCRRPADMAARYGGEEFALILPDTDVVGAVLVAGMVRDAVSALRIPNEHSPVQPYISISGGIAVFTGEPNVTAIQLVAAADRTLYQAKHLGRNRMLAAQPDGAPQIGLAGNSMGSRPELPSQVADATE